MVGVHSWATRSRKSDGIREQLDARVRVHLVRPLPERDEHAMAKRGQGDPRSARPALAGRNAGALYRPESRIRPVVGQRGRSFRLLDDPQRNSTSSGVSRVAKNRSKITG